MYQMYQMNKMAFNANIIPLSRKKRDEVSKQRRATNSTPTEGSLHLSDADEEPVTRNEFLNLSKAGNTSQTTMNSWNCGPDTMRSRVAGRGGIPMRNNSMNLFYAPQHQKQQHHFYVSNSGPMTRSQPLMYLPQPVTPSPPLFPCQPMYHRQEANFVSQQWIPAPSRNLTMPQWNQQFYENGGTSGYMRPNVVHGQQFSVGSVSRPQQQVNPNVAGCQRGRLVLVTSLHGSTIQKELPSRAAPLCKKGTLKYIILLIYISFLFSFGNYGNIPLYIIVTFRSIKTRTRPSKEISSR